MKIEIFMKIVNHAQAENKLKKFQARLQHEITEEINRELLKSLKQFMNGWTVENVPDLPNED